MRFQIQNMTCGGCARSVAKAVQSVDPGARVTADPETGSVEIASDRPRAVLESVLTEAGFPPAPVVRTEEIPG